MGDRAWSQLEAVDLSRLPPARVALHWAVQPIASIGYAAVPERDDQSHAGFDWDRGRTSFVGCPLPTGHRVFVDPTAQTIGVLDASGGVLACRALAGERLATLRSFVAGVLHGTGCTVRSGFAELPYVLTAHPLANGGCFGGIEAGPAGVLAAWFDAAADVLAEIVAELPHTSALRGWPHHFDLATLIVPQQRGGAPRSIGVGLSPGDVTVAVPYFYVSPWPYPASGLALPKLQAGATWHRGGFTAALLDAHAIVSDPDPAARRQQVDTAIRHAIAACLDVLAG